MTEDDRGRAGSDLDERFQLDDSLGTLLVSLLYAVTAMFVAYAASRMIAAWVGLETGISGFLFGGLLLAAFGTISIYFTSARPIRSILREQRDAVLASEAALREESDQHRFANEVQDALEMGETEAEALDVTSRALAQITAHPAEVLLADSSRAHLHQASVSATAGGAGCGVTTPWGCPAVRRGQTLQFSSSDSLSACPRLIDRGTACSAVCVPVTVLGTPMGVIHVLGETGAVASRTQVNGLESLARQAGSRIGVLRAMASSQLQAGTDPLTGTMNRRILEERIRQLRGRNVGYAIVFADLDHFKKLNDTHGHQTGDRALRLFSDVLRAGTTEADTVCRYGGEEFVLLLPETSRFDAVAKVEAIGRRLGASLDSGDVPRFTASFGVADSTQALSPEAVISLADLAMFDAKTRGRDLTVVAEAPGSEWLAESTGTHGPGADGGGQNGSRRNGSAHAGHTTDD